MALSKKEEQELAQLEKEVGSVADMRARTPAPPKGLSPDEEKELQSLEAEVGAKKEPGLMSKALDYGVRALDYPGGFVRTGLATGAGLLKGDNVVDNDDVVNAFKGKAPTSAEYMERLGVEEGPSASIPLTDTKVSTRDVLGFGMDVVTDPLTLISKGIKAVRPAGAALESGGKGMYKSGLKKIDERLAEKGAGSVSDLLLSEGKAGTTKKLAKDAAEISSKAQAERAKLYQVAADKGVGINMGYPLEQSEKVLKEIYADPGLRPMADQLSELMARYKNEGTVSLQQLSDWKTNLYNSLPQSAYDAHGKLKGPAAKFQKAMAGDFKKMIVEAGDAAEKGLGQRIEKLNETMQTAIESRKPMAMQVRRGNTPNAVTAVDAMLGVGAGMAADDPMAGLLMVAGKKGVQGLNSTVARTRMGKGLIDLGKSGAPDALIREGVKDSERRKRKGKLQGQPGLLMPVSGETP